MAFEKNFLPLPFTRDWDLLKMVNHVSNMPFGPTDCSLPMQWALKYKKEFDVFVVFTDNETFYGKVSLYNFIKCGLRSSPMKLFKGIDGRWTSRLN